MAPATVVAEQRCPLTCTLHQVPRKAVHCGACDSSGRAAVPTRTKHCSLSHIFCWQRCSQWATSKLQGADQLAAGTFLCPEGCRSRHWSAAAGHECRCLTQACRQRQVSADCSYVASAGRLPQPWPAPPAPGQRRPQEGTGQAGARPGAGGALESWPGCSRECCGEVGGACLGLFLFGAHFIETVVVSEGGTVDATCPPSQQLKRLFDAAFV